MNLKQFLKLVFRLIVGYFFIDSFSIYNFHFWLPIIIFLFLFPELIFKFLGLIKLSQDNYNYLDLYTEENIYKLMIYSGLISVLLLCGGVILDFTFPSYYETFDSNEILRKQYSNYSFLEASKILSIILLTYMPIVIFSKKISIFLAKSNKSEENVVNFFRILFRLCFLYILIHQIYTSLFIVFDYQDTATHYLKKQALNKFFTYLPIFIVVSYLLLFQTNTLIKTLGINKLQNHIIMNNVNILQERIIYRIAILATSFYLLFRYVTFFKAIVTENTSMGLRPIWSKYDFWSALIIVIFFVGVIRYNKKVVEFLIKN